MKKNFYSLLFKFLFPVWLAWQLGWHLVFTYGIDYRHSDVYLLISIKLFLEGLYFLLAVILLFRLRGSGNPVKLLIIALILLLCVYTLLSAFKTTWL